MNDTQSEIIKFIHQHKLILPGEIVVIGVSGGADSICLLHILAKFRQKLDIRLHIAHLNHLLRGEESQNDALYVTSLANQFGIPITTEEANVSAYKKARGCSIEEASRKLRYNFLARVAGEVGANKVAIGHTKNDQVETILMHILRGSGVSGLVGIKPSAPMVYEARITLPKIRKNHLMVVRPLLNVTREQTLAYCHEQQLKPRIDSSNFSVSFLRNRCRLELLPLLREYNPRIDQSLIRLSKIAEEETSFLEHQACILWSKVGRQNSDAIYLNKERFHILPLALQKQLLRLAIGKVLDYVKDIESIHIEKVINLQTKPVNKVVLLPHNVVCWNGYTELAIAVIAKKSPLSFPAYTRREIVPLPPWSGTISLRVPGETSFSGWKIVAKLLPRQYVSHKSDNAYIANLDMDRTGTKLLVRQRHRGDRFHPLGMSTSKKLQDFMVDAKIPSHWRKHIPIVCSPQQIVWVAGWRIDDRMKITENTKQILHLEFVELP